MVKGFVKRNTSGGKFKKKIFYITNIVIDLFMYIFDHDF